MVEMFNSLFAKLDRDLVKRESTLRNLPSRLLSCAFPSVSCRIVSSRIATLSSFSRVRSNNTYESELEPCGSHQIPRRLSRVSSGFKLLVFSFFFFFLSRYRNGARTRSTHLLFQHFSFDSKLGSL